MRIWCNWCSIADFSSVRTGSSPVIRYLILILKKLWQDKLSSDWLLHDLVDLSFIFLDTWQICFETSLGSTKIYEEQEMVSLSLVLLLWLSDSWFCLESFLQVHLQKISEDLQLHPHQHYLIRAHTLDMGP